MPKKPPKKVILVILDGLGIADANPGNAVKLAQTPNMTQIWANHPHTQLQASGNYVGLPEGTMGNSEVGHMSLGAGKIIFQEIARIDNDIKAGDFFDNKVFKEAVKHAKKNKSNLHLLGLTSHGKVHSSIDHLFACLDFCKKEKLKQDQVFVHSITDGRDTPPQSASTFLGLIDDKLKKLKLGKLATIVGRYYAMDRDERWDRTKIAYDAFVSTNPDAAKESETWQIAVNESYENKEYDEYIKPIRLAGTPRIQENDAVIFFNYRADRALQLAEAFDKDDFKEWNREKLKNLFFAGFSNYEKGIPLARSKDDVTEAGGESQFVKKLFEKEAEKTTEGFPKYQLFPPEVVDKSLGQVLSDKGIRQLRITESEKFPHVTYFFNCRKFESFPKEDRIEIPSPRDVKTYDQKPEMSSYKITDRLIQEIQKGKYDFILVNYALTDMVAHTGNLKASIKAVEVADECLGKVVGAGTAKGYDIIITADHGNIEELINLRTNQIDTQHSTNLVPFIYINSQAQNTEKPSSGIDLTPGMLIDIAPTVLSILDIQIPDEMTGRNLI